MSLQIVITDAGRSEIINAENNGTAPVTISEIGFGSGQYTASAGQTALQSEFKRLNTISGAAIGDDTIHISARDEGTDAYQVYEFGLYLDSGTLFAVYSQNASIIDKTSVSIALLAVDIALQSINPASITFGDANFINPPASTTSEGVVELATNAEVQSGTDPQRVITPASLSSRTATTSRTGLVELATDSETQSGADSNRAITPASLSSRTATTSRTGLVELATNAETQTGSDSNRAVTPASLSSRTASTERTGIVELATTLEAQDGTDSSRAVTPLGLKSTVVSELRNSGLNGPAVVLFNFDESEYRNYFISGAGFDDVTPDDNPGRFHPGINLYRSSNDRRAQLSVTDDGIFTRTAVGTNWNDWAKHWTDKNHGSGSGMDSDLLDGQHGAYYLDAQNLVNQVPNANLPSASATSKGIVELATVSETAAGTDSTRAVTPASLSSRTATTERTGIIELATNSETGTGTDSTRAVTPASLSSRTATTERTGIIELATDSETQAGTDFSRAVTPSSLSSRTATTTRTGLVELATNTEAESGTDSSRAVTPQGAKSLLSKYGTGVSAKTVDLTSTAQVNAMITEGTYAVSNVSMPVRDYGHLSVKSIENERTIQTWRPLTGTTDHPQIFERFSLNGGSSWSVFKEIMTEANNEMVGSVSYFITTVAPDGWIKANGAAVSRTTYAKLFAKVGTFWGAGNGSTTFNIPDLRGEFIRSWDDGRGVDNARAFGSFQADEIKEHRHSIPSDSNDNTGNGWVGDSNGSGIARTAFTGLEGGTETRPRNVALVAYIKY